MVREMTVKMKRMCLLSKRKLVVVLIAAHVFVSGHSVGEFQAPYSWCIRCVLNYILYNSDVSHKAK